MATAKSTRPIPESLRFGPVLTDEQLQAGLKSGDDGGETRRAALILLSKGSDEIEMSDEHGGTFLELAESIDSLLRWRAAETELLEAARARAFALCMSVCPERWDA